jgi:hypothetical protein
MHNWPPYCHLSRLYNGILRSCVRVRLMEMGFSGQNSVLESAHSWDCHLYHLYNGIYILEGVRLIEVGFSGQNSVVESAHNRAPYCHLEGRINCSR